MLWPRQELICRWGNRRGWVTGALEAAELVGGGVQRQAEAENKGGQKFLQCSNSQTAQTHRNDTATQIHIHKVL